MGCCADSHWQCTTIDRSYNILTYKQVTQEAVINSYCLLISHHTKAHCSTNWPENFMETQLLVMLLCTCTTSCRDLHSCILHFPTYVIRWWCKCREQRAILVRQGKMVICNNHNTYFKHSTLSTRCNITPQYTLEDLKYSNALWTAQLQFLKGSTAITTKILRKMWGSELLLTLTACKSHGTWSMCREVKNQTYNVKQYSWQNWLQPKTTDILKLWLQGTTQRGLVKVTGNITLMLATKSQWYSY